MLKNHSVESVKYVKNIKNLIVNVSEEITP